jgi:phosphotransacetylase/acyl dehydratase
MGDYRNRTYAEIAVGETVTVAHVVTVTDVEALALAAGRIEAFHLEEGKASHNGLAAQGAAAVALIAGVLSRRLPGPGSRIVGTRFDYAGTINLGDVLSVTVTATARQDDTHTIEFACRCENQRGEALATGTAHVTAATERIAYSSLATPEQILRRNDGFAPILAACESLPAVTCAIVHPCDRDSLLGAVEAARIGLIVPVLVGPAARIRAVAKAEGVDLSAYRLVSTEHSHAAAAAAVAMACDGEVEALMKGSLHTDELMSAVVATAAGLRTARRISHVFILDVPSYPRLLMITDAAINIVPDLADKADICRNAIDLAHVLGLAKPRVAILSAIETVNPHIASTVDAAALCKMAERGQIVGGIIDGPLGFDNAISADAARIKHIESPVAGRADILLVPDIESGNMLAKQLQYLAGAGSAGIVLGARVPIVLTSRADSVRDRLVSTAVLKLLAHRHRERSAANLAQPQ